MRSGLIATEGRDDPGVHGRGNHVPVTVLKVDNCQVVAQRNEEQDGYTALQLGVGTAKVKRTSQRCAGISPKRKVEPKRKLANSG